MGPTRGFLPMDFTDRCCCFRSPSRVATLVFRSHVSVAAKREAFQRITWACGLLSPVHLVEWRQPSSVQGLLELTREALGPGTLHRLPATFPVPLWTQHSTRR